MQWFVCFRSQLWIASQSHEGDRAFLPAQCATLMGIVWGERRWRRWWHLELITCPKLLHWQIRISRAQIAWEPESATKLQTQIYRVHEIHTEFKDFNEFWELRSPSSSKHGIFYMHWLTIQDGKSWQWRYMNQLKHPATLCMFGAS